MEFSKLPTVIDFCYIKYQLKSATMQLQHKNSPISA